MKQLYVFLLYFFALVCGDVEAQPTIEIDPSFNIGTGFNHWVYSMALQPDGKVLVGGNYTEYNGQPQTRIARLNEDGSLDTSFETGAGFTHTTVASYVMTIVVQPDGKILVGGFFETFNGTTQNRIVRLNSNGTIDTSFNIGTGFNFYVYSIALQPDGKILVGGQFAAFNGTTQNRIVRLNSNGTLDTSFDIGTGFNDGGVWNSSIVSSIILQPDGKILAGGSFINFNGVAQNMLVRLNSDGTLDTSFDIGTGFNERVHSITLQPDGKILVGAFFTTFNGTTQNKITRLNYDGTLDTSFNIGTGVVNTIVNTIALQPDGKILVGGEFSHFNDTPQSRIARLNSDGTLDTSFDIGTGFYGGFSTSSLHSIVIQPDEKILVGGHFTIYNGTTQNRITRLQEVVCPNPPPTPEATVIPTTICNALFVDNIGVLVITSPLGDDYEYSIDGINYQSSPDFQLWLHSFPITITAKQGDCISDPLIINNIEENSTLPTANVTQPDCSDVPESGQFGTITVTFPLGDLFEFQYSIDGINYQDSPVFYNVPPGNYELTFSMYDSENCISDPLEVVINSTNVPTPIADVIQPDCDNPYGIIVVTTPFANAYEYSINGIDYQPGNVFENVSAGTYQVTVRKGNCISEILEVEIFALHIPDIPTVIVVQPDCYNLYGSITVISPVDEGHELFPNYEYSINGVDYYEHTIFDNLSSGLYYVTVRHVFSGCVSDFSEVILKEDLVCFIPKGISPNGDFLNDEFDLSDFGVVPSVQIFNRYGKEVYSQKDYTNQWKGQSSKGKELQTGTYYYVITFQNEEIKTGWVYLNRKY